MSFIKTPPVQPWPHNEIEQETTFPYQFDGWLKKRPFFLSGFCSYFPESKLSLKTPVITWKMQELTLKNLLLP